MSDVLNQAPPARPTSDIEALAAQLLRAVFPCRETPQELREKYIASVLSGADKVALSFEDFREIARLTLSNRELDVEAERAAWRAWYYDHDGYGGKTFGYQDTREGHHVAFATKSEQAWLESAARRVAGLQNASAAQPQTVAAEQPVTDEAPKARKFPDIAYELVDPAYELMDSGLLRHRETGHMRPKLDSGLPCPFKVGDKVRVVDGSSQFPLGTEGRVTHIQQGALYLNGVPCYWERLDPCST